MDDATPEKPTDPTDPAGPPERATPPVEPPTRLSSAALASLLLVLAAILIGCGSLLGSMFGGWNSWVGVLVAPLIALNGCVLAFVGLRSIERSSERLAGRPIALVALFLGVGVTAIQGALVLLALVTLSASSTLAPVGAELVGYAQADRQRLTRQVLSEDLSDDMSDEQIRAFASVVRDRLGTVSGSGAGFSLILDARRAFGDAGAMEGYSPDAADMPRPIYLRFGDERVLAYVYTDQAALQDQEIRVRDMVILLPEGGVIVLAPDGPGSQLAAAAGWTVVNPPADADQDLMLE